MEQQMQPRKTDWFKTVAWMLIFISTISIATYIIYDRINFCTAHPFEYAVKVIKEKFDVSIVYGTVSLVGVNGARDYLNFGDANLTDSTIEINFSK